MRQADRQTASSIGCKPRTATRFLPMTLDCGNPILAIIFAIERAKSLGLSTDDLNCRSILHDFCSNQHVLVTRDRPNAKPAWLVADPAAPVVETLALLGQQL